jgi:hypothetical protein
MKYLVAFLALWGTAVLWIVVQPRESAKTPLLAWEEVRPTLSRSGRWLAFEVDPSAKGSFGRGPANSWELVVWDREAGEVRKLAEHGVAFRSPRLSGEGDKVVFEMAPGASYLPDVCLADTETLDYRPLDLPWRKGGHGGAYAPNISATGDLVSCLTYRPVPRSRRSWMRAISLGRPEKLELPFSAWNGVCSGRAAFSPEGTRVAWESRSMTATGEDYWVRLFVSHDGEVPVALDEPAWEPSLSTDQCAYVRPDDDGVYQIFLHDFQDQTTRVLTRGNDDSFEPCLSEDGQSLVFTSHADNLVTDDENSCSDIFHLDLATSTLTRLSSKGDGNSYHATLSGDGSTVAFSSLATNLGEKQVDRGQIYLWERGWLTCRVADPRDPASTRHPESPR